MLFLIILSHIYFLLDKFNNKETIFCFQLQTE
uniref:Uncharacterized protein n=1 Tax=Rhizophora mucronata TaxID=61149 RepID=A0A2P2QAU9_RHIMU